MHSAPSVSYPVGRCRFDAVVSGVVWLLGCASTVTWVLQAQSPGWRQGAAAVVLFLVGVACLRAWRRSPVGELVWQGSWSWRSGQQEEAGQARLVLDLQHYLLVRWQSEDSKPFWIWLDRKSSPVRWNALRRALYSRAKIEASPGQLPTASRS